jgi:hypothetical protein
MVKNIPTIERSTKIRFGKHATDDQGENTIVFNASNVAIDASSSGSIYMTPLRQEDDITSRDITMLTYNTETKEIIDSNVPAVDLFSINLQYVTNNDNVTSNTVQFENPITAFVTTGNVGIQNINPTHALDVGSQFHVTEGGEVRVGPSILIDSGVTNKIQVSGKIVTSSLESTNAIGISNNNPTKRLSIGSHTFVDDPATTGNTITTSGNVSAAFYHGDSYYLSNLNLNNIVLQGNTTASRTVQFNYADGPALITNGNVGIQNTHGIHTLDVGSNLFVDDKGSNILVVTGNTYTSRKALVGSNLVMDTLGSNIIQVTGNTYTSRKALIGSNVTIDTLGSNVVEVTGNTYTSRKVLVGSNVTIDTLGTNVVEVTGNTYTSRKALVGSNLVMDTLGSNVVEVTGNTYTSRKALIGSNVTIDTLGSNVVEVTGNTYTSRKALIGSNVTIDTLGSNVIEVTGNTYTSRKALVGSNVTIDTLGTNVVEVTGNVNVSNYTKTDYITVQKDAHIKGNLLVEGTTTTIDTTNTTFEDAVISLANNNELATTDIGIIMKQPGSNANPTVTFRGDEKEMMIGYTLNSSLDTEITPDSANVIDLHVYGNIIAQNNITLTSGELTTITLNGNVVGNNVNAITLRGNVVGNNVNAITLSGNVLGNNVNAITLSGNVVGNNVNAITLYGNVVGNNVNAITLKGNVVADNIYVTNNIETTSGFFKGDGGILSNVTLQQVTDAGNTTSNTVLFTNAHTAFTTDLTSNVGVKLDQLSNVNVTGLVEDNILIYDGSNWVNDYNVHNFVKIKNETGDTLYRGNTVYIVDSHNSNVANVALAKSDSPNTMPCIGIIHDDVVDQGEGVAVAYGKVQNVNTGGFTEGQTVYVSNTVAGSVMSSKPFGPTDLIQNVGVCVKSDPSHGVIFVTGVGRSNDIPNAEEVYAQPTYVYVNSSGNELKKILASNLSANNQTLDMVTSWSNSTQNTIQSTHATGFISSGNIHVGSNIFVSGIKDPSDDGISYIPMIEKGTGKLIRSPAYVTNDDTYVINAANAEFTGNLSFTGNTYVFESNTVVINDRILGIANNNASHTLDVGIIMEHPEHNIAFIHHGAATGDDAHEHVMTLGYTQNTVTDNHVLDDLSNLITFQVIGNVIVQNNLTLTSGDLTAITVNSNVVGDNVSVITLNGNVVGDNVNVITLRGNVVGNNVNAITLNGNVVGDNVNVITLRGNVVGDNVNAITLNGNVVGDNVNVITLRGNVVGDNVNAITLRGNVVGDNVNAITLRGNVVGDNVNAITLSGNVAGNNVNAITLRGNVVGDNVNAITLSGNVAGNNVNAITLSGNVVADNVVATNGIYGAITGQNTVSASTIYVGTGTYNLNGYDLRVEGDTEITGNLHVGGTTTTVNTENLVVKDPIIQLGDAAASVDSGLLLARPSDTDNVYVGYDQSESEFAIGFTENHAGESAITVKDNVDFTLNVHGNVEASYFFGDGSQLSGIQTATPTLASVVDEGNVTSNVVRFANVTTGIEITSNIDFVNKITLNSTSGTKSNLFVVNAIQLDPDYAEPSRNVLSYDTTTGEIYDSGGQGGSSFNNITEEGSNVAIGPPASANLTINTFGSNVLTVSGNVSADNITIGGLNVAASPFALDDVVSVYEGANVTANVLTLGGVVTNVVTANTITLANNLTVSGNTTSQNIKLTNTDISASVTSGTITVDAKEKTYGTAPLVVSTTDVSNLVFSNLITGAQIVIPILASGGAINISSAMTNVNFYAMTSDVSVTQDKHALMTLSNLYGNIYMNAIGFS